MRRLVARKISAGHYQTPDKRFQIWRTEGVADHRDGAWSVLDDRGGGSRLDSKASCVRWIRRRLLDEAGADREAGL